MAKSFINNNSFTIEVPGITRTITVKPGEYVVGDYYFDTEFNDVKVYVLCKLTEVVSVPEDGVIAYTYVPIPEPGDPLGVATLDENGLLTETQLPPITITETWVVDSELEMLSLSGEKGDVAIRTDENKTYILATNDPTQLVSWKELKSTTITGSGVQYELPFWASTTGLGSITGSSWNSGTLALELPTNTALGIGVTPTTKLDLLSTSPGIGGLQIKVRNSTDNVTSSLNFDDNGMLSIGGAAGANAFGAQLTIGGSYAIEINYGGNGIRGDAYFGALTGNALKFNYDSVLSWSGSGAWYNAHDTGLARSSAGVVKVTDGSTGIGALLSSVVVTANTGTASPTASDSRTVYTNAGDTDGSTINLPTAATGLEYTCVVTDAQTMTITAASGDVIRIGSNVTASGGSITSNVIGSTVRLVAVDATNWISVATNGTWVF